MTSLTLESCKELGVKPRDAERSKNFFALGLISWMYTRPVDPTLEWIDQKFSSRPQVRDANLAAFKAGLHFGETAELLEHYQIQPAKLDPGRYRNITGNLAIAYGLIAAAQQRQPADPVRVVPDHAGLRHPPRAVEAQELRRAHAAGGRRDRRRRGGDRRRVRRSARHHRDQRARPRPQVRGARASRISLELPLVVVDVQRGGPSTGLPTKTEQSDLLLAMYGRHGESPLPIVAAYSPSHCFDGRVRGCAHRAEVPHAGDPAHRRLRGQRFRAVEAPRHRRRCPTSRCPSRPSRTTTASSGRTSATPRRWPVRGRSRARPG